VILLALLILALLLSLLSGGRLDRLAQVRLKHSHLILLALGIQLLVFSSAWQGWIGDSRWSSFLYGFSLLLLIAATWLNWRVPGVVLLAGGLLLNATVILANRGHMPASLQALRAAGIVEPDASFESLRVTNSSLIDENTPLWFLGDIFAIPKGVPLANVFSVGDVVIGLGSAWFLFANMRAAGGVRVKTVTQTVALSRGSSFMAWLKQGRNWLTVMLALLLIALVALAFCQYRLAGQRESNIAIEAHKAADTERAAQRYARVMALYRLTFGPYLASARLNKAECDLLNTADKARSEGDFLGAITGYQSYLKAYPDGLLRSHVRQMIAQAHNEWAARLRVSGEYEAAVEKYEAILEQHADAPAGERVEAAIAETYGEWATQLRRSGDYEQAIQKYQVLLMDYAGSLPAAGVKEAAADVYREWLARVARSADYKAGFEGYIQTLETHLNTPTGAQARVALAEAYSQWAARLSQTGNYADAIQMQQTLLAQYADAPAAAQARAAIAEAYSNWAVALSKAGDYESAIVRYQTLLKEYADTPAGKGAEAALGEAHRQWAAQLGGWAARMGRSQDYDQIIVRCLTILGDYPDTPTALSAVRVLSDTYQLALQARRNKRPCDSLLILEALARTDHPLAAEAEATLPEVLCNCGWEKRRKGLSQEAVELFNRVIAEYPDYPFVARAKAAVVENVKEEIP